MKHTRLLLMISGAALIAMSVIIFMTGVNRSIGAFINEAAAGAFALFLASRVRRG